MLPNIWGPSLWTYLHLLSANYPDDPSKNEKNYMKNFIKYLGHTLPCDICKNHYFEFMTEKRVNIGVTNKKELLDNNEKLYDHVSELGKKWYIYYTDPFYCRYYWRKGKCSVPNKSVYRFDATRGIKGNKEKLINILKEDDLA